MWSIQKQRLILAFFGILWIPKLSYGRHVCHPYDLSSFCLQAYQIKSIIESTDPQPYPQFKEIFEIFPDEGLQDGILDPHTDDIFSHGDYCELKYVKADFAGCTNCPGKATVPNKENPYRLDVTEISVGGKRLHNWLHVRMYSVQKLRAPVRATGKIKYAFLMAMDTDSFPIGDFNNNIPCGHDCNCDSKRCHQGNATDSIPCMFTDENVVTVDQKKKNFFRNILLHHASL